MAPTRGLHGRRTSCDACNARKVKCDYQQALQSLPSSDSNSISCSGCRNHGLTCLLTTKTRKKKTGVRIEEYRNRDSSSMTEASTSRPIVDGLAPSPPGQCPPEAPVDLLSSLYAGWMIGSKGVLFAPPGLLGIPHLTWDLLNACLTAYFCWSRPLLPVVGLHRFVTTYQSYWELHQGKSPQSRPITEEFLLALAAAGAGMLEENEELFLVPLGNKFDLQRSLFDGFMQRFMARKWADRDDEEAVDVLVGCWILSARDVEGGSPGALDCHAYDVTRTSPISREGIATMVYSLQLNRAPRLDKRAPPDEGRWRTGRGERLLTDEQAVTRTKVFCCLFLVDGCRAMSLREPLSFPDDSHDHDFASFEPARPEGPLLFHKNGATTSPPSPVVSTKMARFNSLIARHGYLALLIRNASQIFISVRSQSFGIPASAAIEVFKALKIWRASLPPELELEARIPDNWSEGKRSRPAHLELIWLLKVLFPIVLYHCQIISACIAVENFGLLEDKKNVDIPTFRRELEDFALQSLAELGAIARIGGTLDILRCHPCTFRDMPFNFGSWACKHVLQSLRQGDDFLRLPGRPSPEQLLRNVEDIAFGISTVDSSPGSREMATALRNCITEARDLLNENRLQQEQRRGVGGGYDEQIEEKIMMTMTTGTPTGTSTALLEMTDTTTTQSIWELPWELSFPPTFGTESFDQHYEHLTEIPTESLLSAVVEEMGDSQGQGAGVVEDAWNLLEW